MTDSPIYGHNSSIKVEIKLLLSQCSIHLITNQTRATLRLIWTAQMTLECIRRIQGYNLGELFLRQRPALPFAGSAAKVKTPESPLNRLPKTVQVYLGLLRNNMSAQRETISARG